MTATLPGQRKVKVRQTDVMNVDVLGRFFFVPIHQFTSYKNNNRRRSLADGPLNIWHKIVCITTDKNCVMSWGPLGVLRSGFCWLAFATLCHISCKVQNIFSTCKVLERALTEQFVTRTWITFDRITRLRKVTIESKIFNRNLEVLRKEQTDDWINKRSSFCCRNY